MAISTTTLYLSFLLASILTLQSLPATSANRQFINKTCNNTPEPDFCIKTLLSDPQSLNTSTVDGLAVIALNIAIRAADAAQSHASELSNNEKYVGLPEQEALDQCIQIYGNASDDLRDAMTDLPDKNFNDAEALATSGETAADSCENEFSSRGIKSLLPNTNKKVKDLCGLCADIIDLLNV